MEIIRQTGSVPFPRTVVALGNFDGLHVAHMAIIRRCHDYAREHGLKCGVLLFNEHTKRTISKKSVPIITQENQKLRLLEEADVDFVYLRDFDKEFMQLSPEHFVILLVNILHVEAVCIGYDYRFGYKAGGDAQLLEELGKKYGFKALIMDEIDHNGVEVKSTAIRHYIMDGSVQHAANMLGRPFIIEGRVVKGLQNGRKIGSPTANVSYSNNMLIPHSGVYAGYTNVDGRRYKSVINVGNNPTFGAKKITIESHIIDFDEDIYNKIVTVEFIKRLRGDRKFESLDGLKEQIQRDIKTAREDLK